MSFDQKGSKTKPQAPDQLKKAKMDYLEMLRGNTAGIVTPVGPLKRLHDSSKKQVKKQK